MSSKIVVTEGNDVKIINDVSKLVTRLSNGETCNWVQEESVRLVTKTIIKDGIYIANNDVGSPYGYSQVSVNGVGNKILGQLGEKSITKNGTYEADKDKDGPYYGYSTIVVNVEGGESGDGGGTSRPVVPGKDSDGDDAVGTIDDDGNIVVEKLPSEIKVIVTPDNLEYEDGQSIVFDGLLVKAYYPDGTEYDSIPTTDLIRPVRVAEFDEETYSQGIGTVESEYGNIKFMRSEDVSISYPSTVEGYNDEDYDFDPGYMCLTFNDRPLIVRETDSFLKYKQHSYRNINGKITEVTTDYTYPVTKSGGYQMAFCSSFGIKKNLSYADYFPKNNLEITLAELFDILKNGNKTYTEGGSQQIIPLQWKRPGDKKVLETSFTITVHGSDDSGDSGGGSGSEPAPTPPPS